MISKELKAKWIEALRSGQYQQGKSYLCKGDKFCCLGVLADVSGAEKIVDVYEPDVVRYVDGERHPSTAIFGFSVGLTDKQVSALVNRNDSGKSFAEIATYISRYMGPKNATD